MVAWLFELHEPRAMHLHVSSIVEHSFFEHNPFGSSRICKHGNYHVVMPLAHVVESRVSMAPTTNTNIASDDVSS